MYVYVCGLLKTATVPLSDAQSNCFDLISYMYHSVEIKLASIHPFKLPSSAAGTEDKSRQLIYINYTNRTYLIMHL